MFVPPSRNNHATGWGWLWAVLLVMGALLSSPAWATLTVTSTTFANGGTIPVANMYTLGAQCQGDNLSPALQWTPGPAITAKYRVQMVDITAGNFLHWRVDNIPPTTVSLPSGLAANQYTQPNNAFGTQGYGGPCPPNDGLVHQYVITVYALDAGNNILEYGALAGIRQYTTVAVPNVVNSTQAAAIANIQAATLRVGLITQVANAAPVGTVFDQDPDAPNNVVPGTPVNLQVSGGATPTNVPVPNIVNQPQATAITLITTANLIVGAVSTRSSTTVPAGSVISQNPAAGTLAAPQSPVNYVVSTGPGTVKVPSVVGQLLGDATTTIQNVGLAVGVVTYQVSTTVPVGAVISQNPVAGNEVAIGTAVNLVVSSGPGTTIPTPNVVGLTQSAAILALQNAGLNVAVTPLALCEENATSSNCICNPALITPADPEADPPIEEEDNNPAGCINGAGLVPGNVVRQLPAAGAAVAPGAYINIFVFNSGQTVVPNVVGLTQSAAIQAIQNNGLKVEVTTEESYTVPAGTVISQDPVAGILVDPSTTVKIVVSKGPPETVTVPDVIGLTQSAAIAAIQALYLKVEVEFETSTTVAAGIVIRQDPVGGVKVAPDSTVKIWVSSGFNPITVPNVVGLTLTAAKTAITGACSTSPDGCLTVGRVTLQASDTVPAGNVINQNPFGGTKVPPDTAVDLVVSSGKEAPVNPPYPPGALEVPKVIGLTQTAAADVVRSVGLSVGAILKQYSDKVPAGIVLDQSPAAGAKVAIGTPVTLTVSLGPAGVVKIPDVRGLPEETAKAILQNAGLTIGSPILRQPTAEMPAGNAIGTDPAAGAQVKIGSTVTLIISQGFSQPQEVAVPGEVIGMTVEDAKESLFAVGLFRVGAITVQSHATIPAGRVSGLNPTAGTMVAYGTTVNLFVSSGSQPPVKTPAVVGLTLAQAVTALNAAGLQFGFISYQTSNTVEADHVISQNPLMTALVPLGWKINLVVSLGPIPEDPGARPTTEVPDVAGLSLVAATAELINAGLQVGPVSNERSAEVPAGQVIRQNPLPGTTLPITSKVNLIVSFGPYAYNLLSGPAYITNHTNGTVSIVNPDINRVVDNIPAGIDNIGPSGIAVHPDGTRLYVANRPTYGKTSGTLSVIDLTERKVIAVIPVGVAPLGVAINPTGERVFVTNEGSFSLSVIDTATNQPFIDMNVPNLSNFNLSTNPYPRGVATHPNPLIPLVYVTNRTANSFSDDAQNPQPDQCDALVARPPINVNPDQCVGSLSIFDADLKTQVGSVAVGWAPEGVAVHPNGGLIYVANSGDRTVSVIESVFNRVIGIINLDEFGGAPQPLVPRGVAVSPDGYRLYVTDGAGDRLFVIDTTANHAVVAIVSLRLDNNPRTPYGVSVSPDSRRVYVANTASNTVSVVGGWNAQTKLVNQVIAEIPVGQGPWAFGQFMGPLATVEPPVFNPPSGIYKSGQKVSMTSATTGAFIRYTLDGSTPTPTYGTLIENGGSVTLTSPNAKTTPFFLRAIAFKEGWMESSVAEASYFIDR